MSVVQPPSWDDARLETDRQQGIADFRAERVEEPLDLYLGFYSDAKDAIDTILELTVDLTELKQRACDVMGDADLARMACYLASPPLSKDDLEVLAGVTMARSLAKKDPDRAERLIDTIMLGLDRERFPWVSENRAATEPEREAAAKASAAMLAMRKVETYRRNTGKKLQEQAVKDFLAESCGFTEAPPRDITSTSDWPEVGHFWGERNVYGRKADVVVRLWDGRLMPIECKVSGSSTNSVKRVLNDAAAKAGVWKLQAGTSNCVPTAVISGVFAQVTLRSAQQNGLTLFWAHSLGELKTFVDAARP